MIIEVIVQQSREILEAAKYGAHRVELVSAIEVGGLTADENTLKESLQNSPIPVHAMVRPHAKSFVYGDEDEMEIFSTIEKIANWGGTNIVFGALNQDGTVNTELLRKIVTQFPHLIMTFHRAIDESKSVLESYETLCEFKQIKHVLTSGGAPDCMKGKDVLKRMVERSREVDGPIILPGSGMTPDNLSIIHEHVKADEYHFGRAVRVGQSFENGFDKVAIDKLINTKK